MCLITGVPAKAAAQNDGRYGKVYFLGSTQQEYNMMVKKSLRRRDRGDTAALFSDMGWGSIRTCNVFIDSAYVCELNRLRYLVLEVQPGTRRFSMQQYGKDLNGENPKITLTIEPDKNYYILMCFDWSSTLKEQYCLQLSEQRAQMLLPSMREDKSCKQMHTDSPELKTSAAGK